MEDNEQQMPEQAAPPVEKPPVQATIQPPVQVQPPLQGYAVPQSRAVSYGRVLPYGMTQETYREKRAIRKTANTIGISLLITELVFSFWAYAFFFGMDLLGIPRMTAYRFIVDPAAQQVLQIILSTTAFLIPALILFKAREGIVSKTVALSLPKKGTVLPMYLLGMAFCMFANIAVSLFGQFFSNFGIEYHTPKTEYPTGAFGFCLSFLSTCIFPAFVEEFVFRGLIMGSLRKYGDGFAVLVSAVLFGLVHGNFEQIPFAFLVGLALGFLVIQTGSLWIGMAVHAVNNLIPLLLTDYLKDLLGSTTNMVYVLLLMVHLALGLTALLFGGEREEGYLFKKATTQATEKQKVKWLVFSPALLIFAGICLFNATSSL